MVQRLVRLSIFIILVGLALALLQKTTVQPKALVALPQLSTLPFGDLLSQTGSQVLGTAVQLLPFGFSSLAQPQVPTNQVKLPLQDEPIAAPVDQLNRQSTELIESIKNLPEDQLQALKRQLYKEFCQNYQP